MNKKERLFQFVATNKKKILLASLLIMDAIIVIKDYGPTWFGWLS